MFKKLRALVAAEVARRTTNGVRAVHEGADDAPAVLRAAIPIIAMVLAAAALTVGRAAPEPTRVSLADEYADMLAHWDRDQCAAVREWRADLERRMRS